MNLWNILTSTKDEIRAQFPCTRRFFDSGFELDPRNHEDNKLGLISLRQVIQLDLATGEFTHVA